MADESPGDPGDQDQPGLPDPGYEQARDELVRIVTTLESGGLTLEESLALWERGEYLAGVCDRWLDGAQRRLDAADGSGTDPAREPRGPV